MTTPLVSVLLPVRDAGPYLEACLASLHRQTLAEHEVVAVDDGSGDGSLDTLRRWAGSDPRVRVLAQPRAGLVAALNAGLDACRGPVVARMDADDVCHPRRLELQLRLLEERPDVGVVGCGIRFFPRRAVAGGFRRYETWLNSLVRHAEMARERFVESPLAHPSAVVRRPLLAAAGGYRDCGWPEDYDLWLRLFGTGVVFAKVPDPLLFWREHGARLTRRDPRYGVDAFLRCKAHFLLEGPLRARPRVLLWGAGRTGRRLATHLLAGGGEVAAFVDIDPAKIGRTARGRPVVAPDDLPGLLAPGTLVLAAVAARGARGLIRARLDGVGLAEGSDYYCVA
jgi:glycosyltransferase involved in cell wall biosynthesis